MEDINNWWKDIDSIAEETKKQIYSQIISEWGKSSVTLKNWLQLYYPFIISNKDYTKNDIVNATLFLPPRKGSLWTGDEAITRLKLAVKAEVIIIFNNDVEIKNRYVIYKVICLRFWTCINSLVTKLSFEEFCTLLDTTYNEVMNNWDETVKYLQEKTEVYKPRKDQTLYHYTREDFESIRYEKNIKAAYNKWIVEVWPTLLDKYKEQKLNKYLETFKAQYLEQNKRMPYEELQELTRQYIKVLDKIKINKIKYIQFTKIIKKLRNGEL